MGMDDIPNIKDQEKLNLIRSPKQGYHLTYFAPEFVSQNNY